MKSRLFQIFLNVCILLGCTTVYADDLIKKQTRQVWKVQECQFNENFFLVKPCYSDNFCKKKYKISEFLCERSIACGEAFISQAALKADSEIYVGNNGVFATTYSPTLNEKSEFKIPVSSSLRIPLIFYSAEKFESEQDALAALPEEYAKSEHYFITLKQKVDTFTLVASDSSLKKVLKHSNVTINEQAFGKKIQNKITEKISPCP